MGSSNIINNIYDILAWILIFLIANGIFRVMAFVISKIKKKDELKESWMSKTVKTILKKLEFNLYIEFINGNFVSLVIGCLMNLAVINFENFGEGLSSVVTIIVTIGIIIYVPWSFYFLLKNR